MEDRDFLLMLSEYLGFTNTGFASITGDVKGYRYEIRFAGVNLLDIHTAVKLFGDDPFKEHIEEAYGKLSSVTEYSLYEDNIDLLYHFDNLSEDAAFSITADITSFSDSLAAYGYKSTMPLPKKVVDWRTGEVEQFEPAQMTSEASPAPAQDAPNGPLPKRFGLGILGAVIGAAVAMGFWVLISMINYMFPFILGAILVVIIPPIFYELFSKDKTSPVEISVCLFLSIVALLAGDRLIWTFNLLSWYDDVAFSTAYSEVPYIVEDGIVDTMDYYQDYIVMFGSLVIFYVLIIKNYLVDGLTMLELLSKKNKRR